jgi:hypothetical protein
MTLIPKLALEKKAGTWGLFINRDTEKPISLGQWAKNLSLLIIISCFGKSA